MYMLLYVPCIIFIVIHDMWDAGNDSGYQVVIRFEVQTGFEAACSVAASWNWHLSGWGEVGIVHIDQRPWSHRYFSRAARVSIKVWRRSGTSIGNSLCLELSTSYITCVFPDVISVQRSQNKTTITSSYTTPEQSQEKTTRVVWNIGYFPISWK